MRTPLNPNQLFGCTLLCLCALGSLMGQTAAVPATSTASTSAAGQDPVTLNPFEVVSDRDVGYTATATMAGSRLNTLLKDTPASISVLTAEFLSDIGAFQLE